MKHAVSLKLRERRATPKSYSGSVIALATKHEKDRAVSHAFRKHLGSEIWVANVDTDKLGTFTGEINRKGTPIEVAKKKARLGMKMSGFPLGIGSEGSFSPHPQIPLAHADFEVLVFIDDELGLEVVETVESFKTNLGSYVATPKDDVSNFLKKVHFGSHGIVVRPNSNNSPKTIFKGIRRAKELVRAISICSDLSPDQKALLETDMRAHMNPTRMGVIRKAAYKLVRRLLSRCPECLAPGWGIVALESGLPCSWCGLPTQMVNREVFKCSLCKHEEKRGRSDGIVTAEAQLCSDCNP